MQIKNEKGYTLIELVVAMTLFVTAFGLVSAAFASIMKTQREIVAFIAANDNAVTAIEQISREMRTGTDFSSGGSSLTFTNARDESVTYRLSNGRLERGIGGIFYPITANNVRISRVNFIRNQQVGFPPRFTTAVEANPVARGLEQTFINLQNTISPRILF